MKRTQTIATLIASAVLSTTALTGLAHAQAASNSSPFAVKTLSQGYQVADAETPKAKEGKCGEGKCGAGRKVVEKAPEAKCGADKKGTATSTDKQAEAKCGSAHQG